MTRSLGLLAGSLLLLVSMAGCPAPVGPDADGGGNARDMRTTDGDDLGGADLLDPEPNRCKGTGCIGAACIKDSDCTEGKDGLKKVCWEQNILDDAGNVPTPGGYCSQECTADADCGTGYCFKFPGQRQAYCMARCRTPNTCRHPGYACAFEYGAGMEGICFPDARMDCKPTQGTCEAVVDDKGNTGKGGCIRVAYEDKGVCHVACKVGQKTCPPDYRFKSPPAQHCIYIDATQDSAGRPSPYGDKWKGAVCWENVSTPIMPGQKCAFWDECTDGYQCDRLNQIDSQQVCRRLCVQPPGMQDDTLFTPAGATVFGSTCGAGESCINAVQAGMGANLIGLCSPPRS